MDKFDVIVFEGTTRVLSNLTEQRGNLTTPFIRGTLLKHIQTEMKQSAEATAFQPVFDSVDH